MAIYDKYGKQVEIVGCNSVEDGGFSVRVRHDNGEVKTHQSWNLIADGGISDVRETVEGVYSGVSKRNFKRR